MFYQQFGLNGPPFGSLDSSSGLFLSRSHREALVALEWGLKEASGFAMLVGEPGTGKTTLVRSLIAREPKGVRIAFVTDPNLRFVEIMRIIASELGVTPVRLGKFGLIEALDAFVTACGPGESVAVIIDEAQNLSDATLEELRLLSNPRSSCDKPLKIVLVGQLELASRLEHPKLNQVNQRIGARALLACIEANEIRAYLEFRLRERGGVVNKVFTRSAVREVVRRSAGIPRRINVLCSNAMLLAYSRGATRVDASYVKEAAREYDHPLAKLKLGARNARVRGWMTKTAGAGLALAVLGFAFLLPIGTRRTSEPVGVQARLPDQDRQTEPKRNPGEERNIYASTLTSRLSADETAEKSMLLNMDAGESKNSAENVTSMSSSGRQSQPAVAGGKIKVSGIGRSERKTPAARIVWSAKVQPETVLAGTKISSPLKQALPKPNASVRRAVSFRLTGSGSNKDFSDVALLDMPPESSVRDSRCLMRGEHNSGSGVTSILNLSSSALGKPPTGQMQISDAPRKIANVSQSIKVVSLEIGEGDSAMAVGDYDKAVLKYRAALALGGKEEELSRMIKRAYRAKAAEQAILK